MKTPPPRGRLNGGASAGRAAGREDSSSSDDSDDSFDEKYRRSNNSMRITEISGVADVDETTRRSQLMALGKKDSPGDSVVKFHNFLVRLWPGLR